MEKLDQVKDALLNKRPSPECTVRDFLFWFGAYRRGYWVVQNIRHELSEHLLETVPDFESEYIDATISFKIAPIPVKNANSDSSATETIGLPVSGSEATTEPTYKLSRLSAANKAVVSVTPDSNLSEATTKMITHDYSQLPVMQGTREIKGYISWKTIGLRAASPPPEAKVRHYMEQNPPVVRRDQSLFKTIPLLVENDFMFVIDEKREICGVITSIDFALQFKQMSEPFLLLGEIENYLRRHLTVLTTEDLKAAKDASDTEREITKVSDLTFGEYVRLLQRPDIWPKLNIKADQKLVCEYMEEVRKIRNDVMHFDPDGIDPHEVERIQQVARLFQTINAI